jgi:hypothetical protein
MKIMQGLRKNDTAVEFFDGTDVINAYLLSEEALSTLDAKIDGHWKVRVYTHDGEVVQREVYMVIDHERFGRDITVRLNRDGSAQEISREEHPAGHWYWSLDDGNLDAGPFISREAAIADARTYIRESKDKILSVTVVD